MTNYRYTLARDLGEGLDGQACWVMLNPSTADDETDDQTIRQVKHFSRQLYRRLIVVNLFAARATRPADLLSMDDPVGPGNAEVIRQAMVDSARVVFAWGGWLQSLGVRRGGYLRSVKPKVSKIAVEAGHTPLCLGRTASGQPKHPCRLPHSTQFEVW